MAPLNPNHPRFSISQTVVGVSTSWALGNNDVPGADEEYISRPKVL